MPPKRKTSKAAGETSPAPKKAIALESDTNQPEAVAFSNKSKNPHALKATTEELQDMALDHPLADIEPVDQTVLSDNDSESPDEIILFPDADELLNDEDRVIQLGTIQDANDESDSSEDEGVLNRVGDIPLEWYDDEDHYGYDVEGKKLLKGKKSALEQLLDQTDDPNAMRTIVDALHGGEKKVISNSDLQMIFNLQRNRSLNPGYEMYGDIKEDSKVDFDPLNHPLARGHGPSKKKFVPALHEMKKLAKMVARVLKEKQEAKEKKRRNEPNEEKKNEDDIYLLWDDSTNPEMDTHTKFKYKNRIEKPKMPPPGTYESYRPPLEYLPSEKTKERQARLRAIDRKEHFLPQAFSSLRHVPFYNHTIQDRYQRCLDLAFFPRKQRTRLVVDPSKLLPELPDPKDLRPYPERLSFLYKGHTSTVRSISVDPHGQYLATGCDDHIVRIYEILTGRLMKRYDVGGVVQQVEFSPNKALNVLAVAVEYSIVFLVPAFCAHAAVNDHTIRFLRAPGLAAKGDDTAPTGGVTSALGGGITQKAIDKDETAYEQTKDLHDDEEKEKRADFQDASPSERAAGIVVKVTMHAKVKRFTFHIKGDYLCALCPKDHVKYRQTVMLQLSKRKVFCPFRKFAEVVTDCKFHPREPLFFLSTTNSVRCYNLLAHKLQKRYRAPGGLTTCLSVHPEGDNFIVGDTTSHTQWYDCDFSDKPYKRMRSHKGVVSAVAFHKNTNAYPLFASGASDGQVHVFHGMVYDDYNKNALIVPVKILKHHRPVYSVCWHPTLPWLFTATEEGTVSCWTE